MIPFFQLAVYISHRVSVYRFCRSCALLGEHSISFF